MHRPTPGPFPGSTPNPDLGMAAFARFAEVSLSALCVIAASCVWAGAALRGPGMDIVLMTKASSGILLVTALLAILLRQRITDAPRLAASGVFGLGTLRLGFGVSSHAAHTPGRAWPRGLAGVVEAVVWRVRGRPAGSDPTDATSLGFNAALHDGRHQARRLAATLNHEANILAEASGEIDAAGSRLAADIQAADGACGLAQGAIARITDHVVALTGAVSATTAEVQRATTIGVGLSEMAFNSQRIIASLDERIGALVLATEQVERLLQRVGTLGQAASVEAARSGVAGQSFAPIAASVQELACSALSAMTAMHQAVAEMGQQTANAAREAQEISERVKSQHERGLAISLAVAQQGEEMTQILRAIDEAQTGFITVRASVEAATRHGTARLAKTDTLRETAERLPNHAEAIATILRGIPDFAPPIEFGF